MSVTGGETSALLAERFQLGRELGAGAFGEVYEAEDTRAGSRLALKILRRLDARSLYRFKREFRALADIAHDNLVRLGELFLVGDLWFFTMELIEGVPFLDHVRYGGGSLATADTMSLPDTRSDASGARYSGPPIDLDRLRNAMRALVAGVSALHRAGKLHRDLKPSNVLVTRQARVVILDFGMVTDVDDGGLAQTFDQRVGTPAYMAPEQAAGRGVTAAADWYSVGVMLYQALTDQYPFLGGPREVMRAKQSNDEPDPRDFERSLPADLSELCRDLLRVNPLARPTAETIAARLDAMPSSLSVSGGGSSRPVSRPSDAVASGDVPLIGRAMHLARLRDALASASSGRMTTVFVRGESGIGKSTLMRRFVDGLRSSGKAVVLEGRCFERESVPYNALDAVVDALSAELCRAGDIAAAKLTPRHLAELCSVFPVLRRVPSFAEDAARGTRLANPLEVRQRAFIAIRELLAKMADRAPLVVYIDNLQWGDVDSGVALTQLFDPPEPPALLFVGSHRNDAAEAGPLLKLLGDYVARASWLRVETLDLGPLDDAEARELATAIAAGENAGPTIETIVAEAGGHPYLVTELARSGAVNHEGVSLAKLIDARVVALPPDARALLEAVVIAGRPVSRRIAVEVAELAAADDAPVAMLVSARLLRTTGRGSDAIETYHNRIRETVRAAIPEDRAQELHVRLGEALEAVPGTPAHVLATHFREGEVRDKAVSFAHAAADEAVRALAFDRAADMFRVVLELLEAEDERGTLLRKLGDALANAGRGVDAADAYLGAAAVDEAAAFNLESRAAMALFSAGHVNRGLEVARAGLLRLGVWFPRSTRLAYWLGLVRLGWFLLRGVGFRERKESEVDALTLKRMDATFAVALGLALTDAIRSLYFSTGFILAALRAGEPKRVGLAMMAAVMWLSALFRPASPRPRKWLETLQALAERQGSARLRGAAGLADGFRHFCCGNFARARDRCGEAESMLVEQSDGGIWELSWTRAFHCWSLFHAGDVRELSVRAPALVEASKQRDDLSLWCRASTGSSSVAWLVRDDVGGARHAANEAFRRWPPKQPFEVIHYWMMLSRRFIDLYADDAAEFHAHVEDRWPALRGSGLMRLRFIRLFSYQLRAVSRVAYAATLSGAERRPLLDAALDDLEPVRHIDIVGGEPLAELVRAGVASLRDDHDAVPVHLRAAILGFDDARMALYAAVTRTVLGKVIAGDEGDKLRGAGESFMKEQGVVRPDRFVAMLAPGLDG